jgi:hypothetical protein
VGYLGCCGLALVAPIYISCILKGALHILFIETLLPYQKKKKKKYYQVLEKVL